MKYLVIALVLCVGFVTACSKPIHLGSLNESGTPEEFVAKLQKVRASGPADVKTRQVLEALSIGVGTDSFTVTNNSHFFIDQLSFSCEVARGQSVYFEWDVGYLGNTPEGQIDWLKPNTTGRSLVQNNGRVTLLHNDMKDYENLGPNQVSWLLHKYHFSDCRPLDISDATEDDPIKRQARIDKCHDASSDTWTQAACVTEGDNSAAKGDAK